MKMMFPEKNVSTLKLRKTVDYENAKVSARKASQEQL